jgi:hypothetical protein
MNYLIGGEYMRDFPLLYDYAWITPKGINFRNKYYCCSRAIREQWFEIARQFGDLRINVAFYPNEQDKIYIQIGENIDCCRSIVIEEYEGSKLEKYFKSIQALKSERYGATFGYKRIDQSE